MNQLLCAFTALALLAVTTAHAQDAGVQDVELEDVDVSYIYPVVMGSGVYRIDGRRLSMLTLPISITQSRLDEEDTDLGVKWYIPVTVGYDEVDGFDWLDPELDETLATLSAMPGVQVSIALDENWIVRPFAQLGVGHDFVAHEDYALGVIGTRLLGTWVLDQNWELRWGASLRFAGETQFKSGRQTSFGMAETGLDLRRDTGVRLAGERMNAGVYYRLQSYYPEWTVGQFLTNRSEVNDVHEFGVSLGLAQPQNIFGFTFRRVRFGIQRGSGFKGWTFGTEFPF
jgi:hypothetical protein